MAIEMRTSMAIDRSRIWLRGTLSEASQIRSNRPTSNEACELDQAADSFSYRPMYGARCWKYPAGLPLGLLERNLTAFLVAVAEIISTQVVNERMHRGAWLYLLLLLLLRLLLLLVARL